MSTHVPGFQSSFQCWALPMTVRLLSPLSGFESHHVRKLSVTYGLGGGFRWVIQFSAPSFRNMAEKVTKKITWVKIGCQKELNLKL